MNHPTKTLCVLFWSRRGHSFDMGSTGFPTGTVREDASCPGGSKRALGNLDAVAKTWDTAKGGEVKFVSVSVDADGPSSPAFLAPSANWASCDHYWTNGSGAAAFGLVAVPAMFIIREGRVEKCWDAKTRLTAVGREVDGRPKPAGSFGILYRSF